MTASSEVKKHWYHTGTAKFLSILLCTVFGILLFCSVIGIGLIMEMDLFSTDKAEIEQQGFDIVGRNYAYEILETCTTNDENLQKALGDPEVIIREGALAEIAGTSSAENTGDPAETESAPADGDTANPKTEEDSSLAVTDAAPSSEVLSTLSSYGESPLEFGILRFSIPMTEETRYYNIMPDISELDLAEDALYLYKSAHYIPSSKDDVIFAPANSWFMYSTGSAASMLIRGSYPSYMPSDHSEYYTGKVGELRTWYGILYHVDTAAADSAGALISAASTSTGRRMTEAFYDMDMLMGLLANYVRFSIALLAASIAGFVLSYILCLTAAGHRRGTAEVHRRLWDRIPYEIAMAAAGGGIVGLLALGYSAAESILRYRADSSNMSLIYLAQILLLLAVLCMLFGLAASMTTAVRIKSRTFWRTTLMHWIVKPIVWLWKKFLAALRATGRGLRALGSAATQNTSLTLRVILLLVAVTFIELAGIAVSSYDTGFEVALLFIAKFVSVPLILWGVIQFERIRKGVHRITEGQLDVPVNTEWMYPGFKDVANHINRAGEGIKNAVAEQLKSERMKTELITNVSHDIKTPLTSIINYVDLLEKEEIDNPKAAEYIGVLDRQSAKLKKLIEDLLEASKAATGNIEMNVEPCDLHLVLSQAMGEFEDRLSAAGLTPVVAGPEQVSVQADARYLWRVFDNLLGNVCKYAMPGTRLYIDLKEKTDTLELTFKNISSSPLNITGEELMERFVQGDRSRNTEGSGLGLSISNSLVSLMGGQMQVDCDGDLFKVTLTFAKAA